MFLEHIIEERSRFPIVILQVLPICRPEELRKECCSCEKMFLNLKNELWEKRYAQFFQDLGIIP